MSFRPYVDEIRNMITAIAAKVSGEGDVPLFAVRDVQTVGFFVVASDRGLCGSYNSNLLFGLKIRPVAPAVYDDATRAEREAFWAETARSGNPVLDPRADWIDYEMAGATGPADMGKLMAVLKPLLAGKADMAEVSKLVKAALAG